MDPYKTNQWLDLNKPFLVWLDYYEMDSFSLVNYLGPVDVENVEAINIIEDG